jgi:hypothetical protein
MSTLSLSFAVINPNEKQGRVQYAFTLCQRPFCPRKYLSVGLQLKFMVWNYFFTVEDSTVYLPPLISRLYFCQPKYALFM